VCFGSRDSNNDGYRGHRPGAADRLAPRGIRDLQLLRTARWHWFAKDEGCRVSAPASSVPSRVIGSPCFFTLIDEVSVVRRRPSGTSPLCVLRLQRASAANGPESFAVGPESEAVLTRGSIP
jgi:hypothetical protein